MDTKLLFLLWPHYKSSAGHRCPVLALIQPKKRLLGSNIKLGTNEGAKACVISAPKRKRRRPTIGLPGVAPGIECFHMETGIVRIVFDACYDVEWTL